MNLETILEKLTEEERRFLLTILQQYQEGLEKAQENDKQIQDFMRNAFDSETHRLKPEYYDITLDKFKNFDLKDDLINPRTHYK